VLRLSLSDLAGLLSPERIAQSPVPKRLEASILTHPEEPARCFREQELFSSARSQFLLRRSLVASSNRWPHELSAGAHFLSPLVFVWSVPRSAQTQAGLSKREVLCRAAAASVPIVPGLGFLC
jgi:hypothetical protein